MERKDRGGGAVYQHHLEPSPLPAPPHGGPTSFIQLGQISDHGSYRGGLWGGAMAERHIMNGSMGGVYDSRGRVWPDPA